MDEDRADETDKLMLDGNAVGGMLHEIFGSEMTAVPARCAGCGNVSEIGALLAFTQAPGVVLRCPSCRKVVVRLVETPTATYVDARGAEYLLIERKEG